jgi:hypothetical protein
MYRLTETSFEGLKSEILKLNRRAAKLKVPPVVLKEIKRDLDIQVWVCPAMVFLNEPPQPQNHWCPDNAETHAWIADTRWPKELTGRTRTMITVEVLGDRPQVAGYTFIAKLEHHEGANIIKKLVEEDLPEHFRATQICEHCNQNRQRNNTYVLRNNSTGSWVQVGSNCLGDFLPGASPEQIAKWIEDAQDRILAAMAGDPDDDEREPDYGRKIPRTVDVETILTLSVASIRQYGYVKRGGEGTATSTYILNHLYPREKADRITTVSSDKETALKVLEWIGKLSGKSDYQYNLQVIVREKQCREANIGILASAVASYNRENVKLQEIKQASVSEYVGTIGKRQEFELTLMRIFGYETDFGFKRIFTFEDASGNVVVVKTTSDLFKSDFGAGRYGDIYTYEQFQGKTFSVKGTVKTQEEYRGVKQTTLSRASIPLIDHTTLVDEDGYPFDPKLCCCTKCEKVVAK